MSNIKQSEIPKDSELYRYLFGTPGDLGKKAYSFGQIIETGEITAKELEQLQFTLIKDEK